MSALQVTILGIIALFTLPLVLVGAAKLLPSLKALPGSTGGAIPRWLPKVLLGFGAYVLALSYGVGHAFILGGVAVLLMWKGGAVGKLFGFLLLALVIFFGPNLATFGTRFYNWSECVSKDETLKGCAPAWVGSGTTSPPADTQSNAGQQPVESPKNVRQVEAQWKTLQSDGTIPVNTESETIETPVYCNIRYPDGYGETYVAQYDTRGQGWATMEPNKHYEAKNIRLKVLVPGIRSLTYTLVCR